MKRRLVSVAALLVVLLLNACSILPEKNASPFRLAGRQYLQNRQAWAFQGRLVWIGASDSLSAAVSWKHAVDSDEIELAGPLSQGAVRISMSGDAVMLDDGESRRSYAGAPESVLAEQLGVSIPLVALKYWVLGVDAPFSAVVEQAEGFVQDGWSVVFREMQVVDSDVLPKKMSAERGEIKIKLVVDQWNML